MASKQTVTSERSDGLFGNQNWMATSRSFLQLKHSKLSSFRRYQYQRSSLLPRNIFASNFNTPSPLLWSSRSNHSPKVRSFSFDSRILDFFDPNHYKKNSVIEMSTTTETTDTPATQEKSSTTISMAVTENNSSCIKRPSPDNDDDDDTNNNNNSDKKPGRNNKNRKKQKQSKQDAKKNHTRKPKDWDSNLDLRERDPHGGSYANPKLREKFGVTLPPQQKEEGTDDEDKKRVKRKIAVLLGFLGTNYAGFQVNLDQRTLQAEMELAFYRAGMISTANFGYPYKYSWSNSARTDKGVHACAQVCSLKVELLETDLGDMEGVRTRLEEHLPEDIRVLDLLRTTRNFCAKTQRDRVRYQYMIPSFLFYPDYRGLLEAQGIPLKGRSNRDTGSTREPWLKREEVQQLQAILKAYRSTQEQRTLLQSTLSKYEGTHSFHNFTKGLKPGQASANRYILSFQARDPVIIDGVEWIPTQVLGQSFLLHQIRKMVSMAIDIVRGAANLETMDLALDMKQMVRVNVAPAQGLFLEMSYFENYNRRKQKQNKELPDINWTKDGAVKVRWEAFRSRIWEHIVQEEEEQGNFVQYMYMQECIFEYRKFYKLDGNDDIDAKESSQDNPDPSETANRNSNAEKSG